MNPEIDQINQKLLETYGRFHYLDIPNYRVVWSTDQFEHRWTNYTREGFELVNPEVRLLPKYRQTDPDRWILERCLDVPEGMETDLVDKFSYEPLWVFRTESGEFIAPTWRAVEFIIECVLSAAALKVGKKYPGPMDYIPAKDKAEADKEHLGKLVKELFGNETDVSDALGHREGIVVP